MQRSLLVIATYRIGIDTGGTFSDFCVLNQMTGELITTKVPSTPRDPSQSVMNGLKRLFSEAIKPEGILSFSYSTTVGTNALLEGKIEKTGVLLTAGYGAINDIYEGAATVLNKYDPYCGRTKSLVRASLCRGIEERVDFKGEVIKPLDPGQAERAIQELLNKDVKSFVVCFLFSFLNPAHERETGDLIKRLAPESHVSLSSDVIPQIREYFRLSTTLVNAMIGPVMTRYLTKLAREIDEAGIRTRQLYIMQCNGGLRTFGASSLTSVPMILSGPAAGLIAASQIAGAAGYKNVITMDMGGTSCDIGLIENGIPAQTNRGAIGKYDIAIPMLDINTISAGGGTIASVDKVGVLRVGPTSAGADPGPVCYDIGGTEPTITDANLALGFINPAYFLGGRMKLDKEKAEKAISEKIARPLNLDLAEAAHGIIEIINVDMEEGIRALSTERGYDVRDFILLAFGGAGGLHAGRLAQSLKIPKVLVPLVSGVTSAMGMLLADVRHDYIRSGLELLSSATLNFMNQRFAELKDKGTQEIVSEGFRAEEIIYSYYLDLRYAGQGYEITVPISSGLLAESDKEIIATAFHSQHERQFGHKAEDQPLEIVNYRVSVFVKVAKPVIKTYPTAVQPVIDCLKGKRKIYMGKKLGLVDFDLYDRELLYPGHVINGPAIIDQPDSTTAVFPGQIAEIDEFRNIIITTNETNDEP